MKIIFKFVAFIPIIINNLLLGNKRKGTPILDGNYYKCN